MRHGKKVNHLGRKSAHRKAMLANMACSLIEHKRIRTTLAKAKALRVYVEPVLSKAKSDTTHSRRTAFKYLRRKEATKILFDEVAQKIADRPGGYTRIIKLGNRLGDNADVAMIELVDYNDVYTNKDESKPKKKRTRRAGKKSSSDEVQTKTTKEEEKVEAKVNTEEGETTTETEVKEEAKAPSENTEVKAEESTSEVKEEEKTEDKEDEDKEEK